MDPTALLETEIVKATCGTYRCFEPLCGFFFYVFFWQGLLVFPTKIARGVFVIFIKIPLDFCRGCSF